MAVRNSKTINSYCTWGIHWLNICTVLVFNSVPHELCDSGYHNLALNTHITTWRNDCTFNVVQISSPNELRKSVIFFILPVITSIYSLLAQSCWICFWIVSLCTVAILNPVVICVLNIHLGNRFTIHNPWQGRKLTHDIVCGCFSKRDYHGSGVYCLSVYCFVWILLLIRGHHIRMSNVRKKTMTFR